MLYFPPALATSSSASSHRLSPAERRLLARLLAKFPERRILVIGDLMLDQFIRGSVHRISPEAPVPVVRVASETFVPGGAGNVAHNLAALGAQVELMGVVGDDAAGRHLAGELATQRIDPASVIVDSGRVTSQKCRVIAEHQQVVRYDRETSGPVGPRAEGRLLGELPRALKRAHGVILSDYGKGVLSPQILQAAISGARQLGLPIIVDPKVENFRRYKRVTCLTPNTLEAWTGMGKVPQPGEAPLVELGRSILKTLHCESLLITRGGEGMSLFSAHGGPVHIPTQAKEVFDVTGAGDTVISVLTLARACGADSRLSAVLANCAAGIVVAKLGTAVATAEELREALR